MGDGENAVLSLSQAVYLLAKDKKFHAKDNANQILARVIKKYGFVKRDLPKIPQHE